VPRGSGFSAQTLLVLAALSGRPADWRHGYDLAKQTGLKSGTLYPILVRLADRGLVEARWEELRPGGRSGICTGSAPRAWPGAGGAGATPTALPAPRPAAPRRAPMPRPARRQGLAGEGL